MGVLRICYGKTYQILLYIYETAIKKALGTKALENSEGILCLKKSIEQIRISMANKLMQSIA